MTDSPNRRHLSRRVVVACYAISVGGFLGMSMVGTGFVMGDPWFALLFPVYGFPLVVRDMMGDPATELGKLQTLLLLLCLCPMLLPLLGLSVFGDFSAATRSMGLVRLRSQSQSRFNTMSLENCRWRRHRRDSLMGHLPTLFLGSVFVKRGTNREEISL